MTECSLAGNRKAFLNMLAFSEGTAAMGDNGYNVLVGSTPAHPVLFDSYADHPDVPVDIPRLGITSTAAGRYQVLHRYWVAYKALLKLPDFSPRSQDLVAQQQISERRGALDAIDAGRLSEAIVLCSALWASLPGAGYGQREQGFAPLRAAYLGAGGELGE